MAEGCVNLQVLLSALAVLVGGAAAADEIVLTKSPEQNQPAEFAYRFDMALTEIWVRRTQKTAKL